MDTLNSNIWGIPAYTFWGGIGALAAMLCYNYLLARIKANVNKGNRVIILSLPAMFIGAYLFGIIKTLIKNIVHNVPITVEVFYNSGIVYYGGLVLFLIVFELQLRRESAILKAKLCDAVAVSIPLFHMFGRIGCYMAGCCYGIISDNCLSVYYINRISSNVIAVNRIPVQLIEAGCNGCIFIVLLVLILTSRYNGKLLWNYLALYSMTRFIIEFIRGDVDRSVLYGISMSQVISVGLFVVVIFYRLKRRNISETMG